MARVVVDLVHAVGYSSDSQGGRLLVRMHPMAEARQNIETPSVAALTKGDQPAFVPVVPGSSGVVVEAADRLAGNSALTAGAETTILRLARGGEVRVCPKTTLSVTPSENGRDLMLGMSTGALEAHYTLNAAADSVVTPDFRMLLSGPGEVHYAISANSRGDTCVRALPGNTASVVVSELMGNGTYQAESQPTGFLPCGTAGPDRDHGTRRLRLSAPANPCDARGVACAYSFREGPAAGRASGPEWRRGQAGTARRFWFQDVGAGRVSVASRGNRRSSRHGKPASPLAQRASRTSGCSIRLPGQ